MPCYWQLVIHQSNGEERTYCYITESFARYAQEVMEARGAKCEVLPKYVGER